MPATRRRARLLEHPAADLAHEARLLGQFEERGGPQQTQRRMVPANERLDAHELAVAHVHLRLIVQDELVALDRLGAGRPRSSSRSRDRLVHVWAVETVDVEPVVLGRVHRRVGVLDELVLGAAVVRVRGDAHARAHVQLVAVDVEAAAQRLEDALGQHADVVPVGHPRDHGELVAALPGHGVLVTQEVAKPLGHGLQHAVADRVAQGVVDGLEVVEVHEHHGHDLVSALGPGERGLEPVVEQGAVGKIGERVVVGHALDGLWARTRSRDVAHDALDRGLSLVNEPRERELHVQEGAVGAAQLHV